MSAPGSAEVSSSSETDCSLSKKRSLGAFLDDSTTAPGAAEAKPGDGAVAAVAKCTQSPAPCNGAAAAHARYCRILNTDSICLDANLSDEFKWPSERMRSKGGLSEWPLWGWLGALRGRTGKVVHVWDRKPKDGKTKASVVPKKCCKGSRQAGFRLKDVSTDTMEKTMLLLEIDKHFVPILEEGTSNCGDSHDQWDECEMCIFVERWVDQAVNEYHIPVHVLAQRAKVSNAEMWAWHQHVTETARKSRITQGPQQHLVSALPANPVTSKMYRFLLKELSCEVCSGRLCRCCFSFCAVCEQLHCKTCSADCVRCEDCLAFFDTAEWCAECGDDFCGCNRDALHCDHCRESLCSSCATIFPCFNCRKGYCLIKTEDDVSGCAIRDALWMCPDCRSTGYCTLTPQPLTPMCRSPLTLTP
jgi:hypothetical protein